MKVILVLDKNCPYSKDLINANQVAEFIDSIELTQQNLGLINDPQPDTIFVCELPKLTEFVFGASKGRFKKLTLKDRCVISYLWKDIINIICEEETQGIYYGVNGNFKRFLKDSKEYIYLKKDLVELKGDRYKDKRNLCNYFQKNYSYIIKRLTPSDEHITLYKKWAENKIKKGITEYCRQLIEDSLFFHRGAFLDFDKLGLEGIEIRINPVRGSPRRASNGVNDKLAGYTFGFGQTDSTFCILGEITDLKYKGISQFIFREFCRVIKDGYIYINTLDDSEIEGLRRNKLSYRPIT